MFRIDVALHEARDRQAALRRASAMALLARRPATLRRQLGAWLVRTGRVIGGPSTAHVLRA
jgi:deoxycytidylate deaminase